MRGAVRRLLVQACAVLVVCWIGLGVAACEGSGSEGQVTARTIDARTPATIVFPAGTELGLKAALEVRVKPLAAPPGDNVLLRIDLVESDSLKAAGTAAEKLASGTVSFFPPPRVGEERAFVVPLDKASRGAAKATSLTAIVTMLPANAARAIDGVKMEVVGARLR